ncbi:MAG TPA: DegT/DnrJ/EryC1/StrS family aminotransferase [Terriglobales bacterium]|nr:DegT/DnrJ/EryC1/StrS family aminotransferase [Terriglobales bacterium]
MVPYLDLKAQYRSIKPEIDAAIARVLESCQFVLGEAVAGFERDFATYCGAGECVAVNSGTSAIHLALLAAGVGPDDEVITTPFTFVATVAAILYTGAKPVLVDIDPASFNIDVSKVEAAISKRTKALLPVHLYGQPADMDPLLDIAQRRGIALIEDAAQAHGAEYKGRRCGSMGVMACFSFYPGKNLGAYGEGGAVATGDPQLARKLRLLRDWGAEGKYNHVLRGFNYRMEGMQGAVLGVKLRHLESWTEARRAKARRYDELLAGADLQLPREMPYARHVYHTYTIRSADRDALQKSLAAQQIQTGIHYPVPVHLQPAYADLGYGKGSFPQAEQAAREVLSVPIFPEMTDEQQQTVANAVLQATAPASRR